MSVFKTQEFESTRVEICRNCKGTGQVIDEYTGRLETCSVCDGKGRIKKTTKGVLTVENL